MQIPIVLDRDSSSLLVDQLADQVRDAIRQAQLAPGLRLPSSRHLAGQLFVGRNTVVHAYERLLDEGYIESKRSSGYFVTRRQEHQPFALRAPLEAPEPALISMPVPDSPERAAPAFKPDQPGIAIDFRPGRPSPALFPLKTWRRAIQASLSRGGSLGSTRYDDPAGLPALRAAIAAHLASTRGILADASRILVTAGTQQGLDLAARLFLKDGVAAIVESPGYAEAAKIFASQNATVLEAPIDEGGLLVGALPDRPAALIYVTPAHQYPTGRVLSKQRRVELIDWARRQGCYILEDDYDGDLRYEGSPSRAMAAIAPDCVIHLGTFSQTLGQGLRLGFMVLPEPLVQAFTGAKALADRGNAWLAQAALADLIASGSYSAHLTRVRGRYKDTRNALLRALRRCFGIPATSGDDCGLHFLWHLPPGLPDAEVVEILARRAGVGVASFERATVFHPRQDRLSRRSLVLGFANLTTKQIEQGIMRLSDAIDDAVDEHLIPTGDLFDSTAPGPVLVQEADEPSSRLVPRSRQQPVLRILAHRRFNSASPDGHEGTPVMATVTGLFRYPIKGLSPQPVSRAMFETGKPMPMDRIFAFARPGAPVDHDRPQWAKKGLFIMLMLEEQLASVKTSLDLETMRLSVLDGNDELLSADLGNDAGRREIEAFFQALVPGLKQPPRLLRSAGGHFMDKPDHVVSLINLATIRSLEAKWGYAIDPLRFRANIYIDGLEPWEEFSLVDQDVRIGGVLFRADRRNGRCSATNVNPVDGKRDLDIPGSLRASFGHKDIGVYLLAKSDGLVAVGDRLTGVRQDIAGIIPAPVMPLPLETGLRFTCRGCYYIYAESRGAPAAGIPPGTLFSAIGAAWRCPDCGTDKSSFRPYAAPAAVAG